MSWRFAFLSVGVLLHLGSVAALADSDVTFEARVRPILKAHCFHCHGEGKTKGKLDVRLARLIRQGGESGAAIVPGKPGESLLIQKIREGEMPKGEKQLSPADVSVIEAWVAGGAKTARPEPADASANVITDEERAFWAFQPVKHPAVPIVPVASEARTAIDAFLWTKIRQQGLEGFAPEADRATLIRRVTFDLTGLPPTPEQVRAFVNDPLPDAYERLVDRLLADPAYGERWARQWLDVAGYAESDLAGESEKPRPYAYKYRDYVIRSFNADKPFDQFVREQLAGDEMVGPPPYQDPSPDAREKLIATGFLRMAPDGTEAENTPAARNQAVAETVKVVSSSLLGLTVGCAQCHDHRYDPIPQVDYYRFRAIFDPAFDVANWRKPAQRLVSLATADDRTEAQCVETLAASMDKDVAAAEKAELDQVFEREIAKVPEADRPAVRTARNTPVGKRTPAQVALLKRYPSADVRYSLDLYDPAAAKRIAALRAEVAKVRAGKPAEDFIAACTEAPGKTPTVSRLLYRGDPDQPKQVVSPGELSVLVRDGSDGRIPDHDPARATSGRRLAYAKRLTDGTHPLLGRVIVNRVWLGHFGRGIVATPGDFGVLGERPTHPELLDWLAADFAANGWRLKRLHKMIVMSRAYTQSSRRSASQEAVDPENKLVARMNVRRLDAEEIRDALLVVSGRLNRALFGPSVPVGEDHEGRVLVGRQKRNVNREAVGVDDVGDAAFRRSLYIEARRRQPLAMLDAFDLPTMTPNCDLRRASTVAPQALMMMNDAFVVTRAEDLAADARKAHPGDRAAQVALAWSRVYGRDPSPAELSEATAFVATQEQALSSRVTLAPATLKALADAKGKPEEAKRREAVDAERRDKAALAAMASLCQALMASNEFLYVD
jgi:mono/diheme cytochrome c family protein